MMIGLAILQPTNLRHRLIYSFDQQRLISWLGTIIRIVAFTVKFARKTHLGTREAENIEGQSDVWLIRTLMGLQIGTVFILAENTQIIKRALSSLKELFKMVKVFIGSPN